MELRAVATSTTDPHVAVVDLDLSFRDRWWAAQNTALQGLVAAIGGKFRVVYKKDVDRDVTGWHTDAASDGYMLVKVRRRLWWRQGQTLLRMTGFVYIWGEKPPTKIHCLLYEPDYTEQVRQMLASLGKELGVTHELTVIRTPRISAVEGWKWLGGFPDRY